MIRDSLIVLNTTKVGDSSMVLHTLSRTYGRRSFITSAGKGRGMALYLPLNILDAEVVENPKSELWRLRGISAKYPLNGIRSDVSKNSMTLFISEVLYRAIRSESMEPGLFEWCEKSILTLDSMTCSYANFHLRFLLELCGAMGFSPSPSDLAPFAGDQLRNLSYLVEAPFAQAMLLPLSGTSRNAAAEAVLQYLGFHTESRLNIQSLKVLRELFG